PIPQARPATATRPRRRSRSEPGCRRSARLRFRRVGAGRTSLPATRSLALPPSELLPEPVPEAALPADPDDLLDREVVSRAGLDNDTLDQERVLARVHALQRMHEALARRGRPRVLERVGH